MPEPVVRIGGSGLTVFSWQGQVLAFVQTIQDTSPQPVAAAVPVQSITDEVPSEVVTSRAVGPGTLRVTFYEKWLTNVWQDLPGFADSWSLLDVLKKQLSQGSVSCRKIIKTPGGGTRTKIYQNCVITDIDDSEQINISTMVLPKGITIMYTHAIHG